jgi:hypothetical protein
MRDMLRKYQNVFRSRWKAVMWSMGIMLTAYCSVPSADSGGEEEQLAAVAGVIAGQTGEQDQEAAGSGENHHVNPWALPPKEQH